MTKWIAAPLFVVALLASGDAEAQMFAKHKGHRGVAAYEGPSIAAPAGPIAGAPAPATTAYPYYSYYAAYPRPARGYVGYGDDGFPFRGQAYGHPYDPWSWPYMSGGNASVLARYYDPPVK